MRIINRLSDIQRDKYLHHPPEFKKTKKKSDVFSQVLTEEKKKLERR